MRTMGIVAAALLAGGCQPEAGYARPAVRNHGAVGAPAIGVGTSGLAHPERAAVVGTPHDAPPGTPVVQRITDYSTSLNLPAPQAKVTEVGQVHQTAGRELVLQRPDGVRVGLRMNSDTSIVRDGERIGLRQVRPGAEVRASYVLEDGVRVAESIEVLGLNDWSRAQMLGMDGPGSPITTPAPGPEGEAGRRPGRRGAER